MSVCKPGCYIAWVFVWVIAWVLVCLLAWVLVWGSFIVCLSVLPRSDTVNQFDGFQDTVHQRQWNLSVSVCLDSVSVVYNEDVYMAVYILLL